MFQEGACANYKALEQRVRSSPLYEYATEHWGDHARASSTLHKAAEGFLLDTPKVEASAQLLMVDRRSVTGFGIIHHFTGLHLAAYLGIEEAVTALFLHTPDLDPKDNAGRTPLSYSAEEGHTGTMRLLLATGKVEVDSKDDLGRTPLIYAAVRGHETAVQLLIETGEVDLIEWIRTSTQRHFTSLFLGKRKT